MSSREANPAPHFSSRSSRGSNFCGVLGTNVSWSMRRSLLRLGDRKLRGEDVPLNAWEFVRLSPPEDDVDPDSPNTSDELRAKGEVLASDRGEPPPGRGMLKTPRVARRLPPAPGKRSSLVKLGARAAFAASGGHDTDRMLLCMLPGRSASPSPSVAFGLMAGVAGVLKGPRLLRAGVAGGLKLLRAGVAGGLKGPGLLRAGVAGGLKGPALYDLHKKN